MTEPLLFLWRLTPVAQPDDPAWQGRRIWSELEIVAQGAGEAIHLASRYDRQQAAELTKDSQDRQQIRSGFEDEKLYRVDRQDRGPSAGALAGEVTCARLFRDASPS